ncbi:MAG: M20/M25/M40 family metallo-hydrolase [Xanthomonadales bacterium]|nr:M20/M25/M40 family metallo-hydrolase [Xanthomonadales bacterium]
MIKRFLISTSVLLLCTAHTHADQTSDQVSQWRQSHEQQIVDEFAELLSIPNVASDTANIRKNARHISGLLKDVGMKVELLELEGSNPVVFAERKAPGASKTVMIYVHYDGQPVNPDNWASDPWVPVMRTDMVENNGKQVPMKAPFDPEWRIFGRSAGDDKAPVIALRSALLALENAGIEPTVNLKIFMEGEEEAGSPNLRRMLEKHKDKLDADLWLFCDGPAHQSRRWQLVYGVRGSYGFNLTVYGPNRPLHSGHYGNWAPNPIILLTDLIGSMRAANGDILVDGYSDQVLPLSSGELAAIDASPRIDDLLVTDLGIGAPETTDRIEMAISRPAMNLRGIHGGDVGAKARNVIQPSASASIGLRLVPAQTPEYLRDVIEEHIETQGFHIIHAEPTTEERNSYKRLARIDWSSAGGYPAYRAAFDNPLAIQISTILDKLSDRTLIQTPTMGGSLPLYVVEDVLDVPILILPVANHDNNQHGANENLRLQNLWDAIEIYAAVLTGL